MAVFDGTGLTIDRYADIIEEMRDSLKVSFGAGVNLSESSPIGVMLALYSDRLSKAWEALESVYINSFPDQAYGIYLDYLCAFNAVVREPATYSAVDLVFTRSSASTADIVIPAGTEVSSSTSGDTTTWVTSSEATILSGSNTITVAAVAEDTGPISAPINTLQSIITAVANVESVTNPAVAVLGTDKETDTKLRTRRWTELGRLGTSTESGIRSGLQSLSIVDASRIILNDTVVALASGQPPHSVECSVDLNSGTAGDATTAATIAQQIWDTKGAGIQTFGGYSGIALDENGDEHIVYFDTIDSQTVYVRVALVTDSTYDSSVAEPAIRSALADYSVVNLTAGVDVLNYKIGAAVANVGAAGILEMSTTISLDDATYVADSLTIPADKFGSILEAYVTFPP